MYRVYAITDIGRQREQNQDGFMLDGICCSNTEHREIYYETDAPSVHVAICDGVGSTQYAVYAVEKAMEFMSHHLLVSNEHELEKTVVDMNAYVYRETNASNKADAASTIAGIVLNGNAAYAYNIGDSPIFSINNGYLEQLSVEDTGAALFGEAVDTDADGIQIKPPLLQSIGTNELLDLVHIKKCIGSMAYMLCSDGITDILSLDEMEEILASSESIKEVAEQFVNAANCRGGFDNSTVILLVDEED